MHIQKHLNSETTRIAGKWPRGRHARLDGDILRCELDDSRGYDFMTVLSKGPHIAFLGAESTKQLLDFVNNWGPISIPDGSPIGQSVLNLRVYRLLQRKLRATIGLFDSYSGRRNQLESLSEYFLAVEEEFRNVSESLNFAGDIPSAWAHNPMLIQHPEWVNNPPPSQTSGLIREIINTFRFWVRLNVDARSRRVTTIWEQDSLQDALFWMVCQDGLDDRLPQVCPECQKMFRPLFRHRKKFCTTDCAQRSASRNYQTRLRKKRRQETAGRKG